MLSLPAVPTDSDDEGAELMMSTGLVPVSAEIRRTRTSPPIPPPMGSAIPIPRRSSMFPLPARPCHLMSFLQPSVADRRVRLQVDYAARMPTQMAQL